MVNVFEPSGDVCLLPFQRLYVLRCENRFEATTASRVHGQLASVPYENLLVPEKCSLALIRVLIRVGERHVEPEGGHEALAG